MIRSAEIDGSTHDVVMNAKMMAAILQERGVKVSTGGTDSHIVLIHTGAHTGKDVANQLQNTLNIEPTITGVVIAIIAGLVIIGGVKRISTFASALVPLMAVIYIVSALVIVIFNFDLVPGAFGIIIDHAFNGTAATGGFAGATVLMAIRFGIARGVFSNEAGLGSAPIAHAAAKTKNPP